MFKVEVIKTENLNTDSSIKKFVKNNILIFFLIFLCIVITIVEKRFISPQNIINVMIQVAINAFLATGMTFVIVTGGIDLSVGSVAALSGVAVAYIIKSMSSPSIIVSILIGLGVSIVVGGVCGGISAVAISKLNVAPFIATLAMYSIARGFGYVITGGKPIFQLAESFKWLGQSRIFNVLPILVLLVIIVMVIAYIILDKTPYGRHVYSVGSNEGVSYLSGVNVSSVKASVYIISGILSALGGVCLASKLGTGQPAAAVGYELTAIAAVVMGGTSLSGGKGGIGKTVVGVLTIGVINNGLNLMNVSSYWQTIVMGAIILLAVILDQYRGRGKK